MEFDSRRCRRCGTFVSEADEEFTHYLFLPRGDDVEVVPLHMCRPCAGGFAGPSERDTYARAGYLV